MSPDKLSPASGASFYTLSEVRKVTDIAPHVLRYWEKRIPQLSPQRNQANRRVYSCEQLDLVIRIQHWLQHDGMTIDGVCKQLAREQASAAGACNSTGVNGIIRELESILAEAQAS